MYVLAKTRTSMQASEKRNKRKLDKKILIVARSERKAFFLQCREIKCQKVESPRTGGVPLKFIHSAIRLGSRRTSVYDNLKLPRFLTRFCVFPACACYTPKFLWDAFEGGKRCLHWNSWLPPTPHKGTTMTHRTCSAARQTRMAANLIKPYRSPF